MSSKPDHVVVHLVPIRSDIYRIVSVGMPGELVLGFEDVRAKTENAKKRAEKISRVFGDISGLPARVQVGGPEWLYGDGSSTLDDARAGGQKLPPFARYYAEVSSRVKRLPTESLLRMARWGHKHHLSVDAVVKAANLRPRSARRAGHAGGFKIVSGGKSYEADVRAQRDGSYEVYMPTRGAFSGSVHVGRLTHEGPVLLAMHPSAAEERVMRSLQRHFFPAVGR
jgi:hypothetical protein